MEFLQSLIDDLQQFGEVFISSACNIASSSLSFPSSVTGTPFAGMQEFFFCVLNWNILIMASWKLCMPHATHRKKAQAQSDLSLGSTPWDHPLEYGNIGRLVRSNCKAISPLFIDFQKVP